MRKQLKDSPSTMAFLSPAKRRVISELVTAQNNIKSKFKRAYIDRLKREREAKKIFKPILLSIDSLHGKGKKKNRREVNEVEREAEMGEVDEVQPPLALLEDEVGGIRGEQRVEPSTPKMRRSFTKQRQLTFDDSMKKRKRAPGLLSPKLSSRITRSLQKKLRTNVDDNKYNYKVVSDYQDIKNYHQAPTPHLPVNLKRVSQADGDSEVIKKVDWQHVPKSAKREWLDRRQFIYDLYKRSLDREMDVQNMNVQNMEVDATPVRKLRKRGIVATSPRIKRKKKRKNSREYEDMDAAIDQDQIMGGAGMKAIDFNFIPYNVKNRVIYEYFDDPNEICDRLRLLISSRMAGNSNHMQEINSIIEELRELKCIV